ncbi:MAG: YebC/PmpR family DNA-binding transcriptional regulator [Candidatus Pacebacteria bacterium]|nr:YebC/PmpR family DNA-binding transcriptional regulator [Candidatus Paceibacterota bacterium]MDR3583270.1 YebC/PmpR family DNA-binding transcriptional regulator [Candidatus Paceibacterota bacterium]
MSGHSHWAGIKQRKGVNDAKRAKIFTRLAKPITIAARDGGGNPDTNFKLRMAIDKAREFNMPKDNIDRAVKRGTGELKGAEIVEITYEAMGPGGIMLLIKTTTDNKNRTLGEIKTILTKNGGKFGEAGSAMWNFEQAGSIILDAENKNTEELEMVAIEAGAKDIKSEENNFIVFTEPHELQKVQETLEKSGLKILEAGLTYLPKSTVAIDEETRLDYEKLLEALDEQDDVDEIYDNL